MTQIATVTDVPGKGLAHVRVDRQTACGHDCENCGGCGAEGGSLTVLAQTQVPVQPGDVVELYSGGQVLGIAALVYLLPVALFFLGVLLPGGAGTGVRYLCGGVGFVLGLLAAVLYDRRLRRKGSVRYQITRLL
jgi:sigma-E factor negative regulatory protein RseC